MCKHFKQTILSPHRFLLFAVFFNKNITLNLYDYGTYCYMAFI